MLCMVTHASTINGECHKRTSMLDIEDIENGWKDYLKSLLYLGWHPHIAKPHKPLNSWTNLTNNKINNNRRRISLIKNPETLTLRGRSLIIKAIKITKTPNKHSYRERYKCSRILWSSFIPRHRRIQLASTTRYRVTQTFLENLHTDWT